MAEDFTRSISTSSVSGNDFQFQPPHRPQSGTGEATGIVGAEIIPGGSDFVVPGVSTFSGIFNATNQTYYTYFDEALRDSQQNALAMARDEYINELMYGRIYPVISLPDDIDVDDPEDPGQIQVAKELKAIIQHIKKFNNMKKNLMRAVFYGKQAAQIVPGEKKILGRPRVTIVNHLPVNGDKVRYKWNGTPGIAIYPGYRDRFESKFGHDMVENTNLGPALFLKTPYLRNKFIIHNFEPSDTDYLFEIDMSQAVHGLGLRSRYYWGWQKLMEVSQWFYEALERIGANGMLIGFFKSGNMAAKQAVWNALINIQRNNMCVFEVDPSYTGDYGDLLQRLEPSSVAYDVMFNCIVHLQEVLRRGFLGQNLSSSSAPTGLGSGVAEFQESTRDNIVRSDAVDLAETIDDDLMPVLRANNYFEYNKKLYRGDDLPFGTRYRLQVDDGKIQERIDAAEKLVGMGVSLDADDLRDQAGFSAPKSGATTIQMPGDDQNVVPVAGGPSSAGAASQNGRPKSKSKSNIDRNIFNATEDDCINHIAHYLKNSNAAKAAGVIGAAWNSAEQSIFVLVSNIDEADKTSLYDDLTDYLGYSKIEHSGPESKVRIRAALDGDVYLKPKGFVFIDLDAYYDDRINRNAFLESDHPRHPKGSSDGGQFRSNDSGGGTSIKERKFGKTKTANAYIEVRDIDKLSKSIFGRVVPVEDIITMAGLPDDAHCEIMEDLGMIIVDSQIHGVASVTRSFGNENGYIYIHNDFLSVNENVRGQGIALQIFGRQVEEAIEQNVSHIECFAARSDDPKNFLNGYEVWPKFGYDGYLSSYIKEELSREQGDWVPRHEEAKVSDLYKTREGYEWWKKHGEPMMMSFDLTPGSYSRQTWEAYLAARERRAATPHAPARLSTETKSTSPTTKENQSMISGPNDGEKSNHDASNIDRESDPSVMISLWIPTHVAKRISVPKGEPMSRLHITLAYLGRQSELGQETISRAHGVCEAIVNHHPSIQALLDGYGRFPATVHSDNKDVIYLNVNSDQLMNFRRQLCQILDMADIPYKKNFEYNPHVTLSYVRDYEPLPADPGPINVTFDSLSFSVGKDIEEFEFNKTVMEDAKEQSYAHT